MVYPSPCRRTVDSGAELVLGDHDAELLLTCAERLEVAVTLFGGSRETALGVAPRGGVRTTSIAPADM
jgi:hypothetical protein